MPNLYSTNSPFFDKNALYGSTVNNDTTPYVIQNLDPSNPQGRYTSFLASNGLGGTTQDSIFGRNLYSQTLAGYQAALRTNPGLSYSDYLTTQFGNNAEGIKQMFVNATPEQRGERPNQWINSTARAISWG